MKREDYLARVSTAVRARTIADAVLRRHAGASPHTPILLHDPRPSAVDEPTVAYPPLPPNTCERLRVHMHGSPHNVVVAAPEMRQAAIEGAVHGIAYALRLRNGELFARAERLGRLALGGVLMARPRPRVLPTQLSTMKLLALLRKACILLEEADTEAKPIAWPDDIRAASSSCRLFPKLGQMGVA